LDNFGKVKAEPVNKFYEEEKSLKEKLEDAFRMVQTINERNLVNNIISVKTSFIAETCLKD